MLLMVKEYLKLAYGITSERIAAFHPNQSEKRKVEERMIVARNNNVPLKLSTLNLNASLEAAELRTLYKVSKFYRAAAASLFSSCSGSVYSLLELWCRTELQHALHRSSVPFCETMLLSMSAEPPLQQGKKWHARAHHVPTKMEVAAHRLFFTLWHKSKQLRGVQEVRCFCLAFCGWWSAPWSCFWYVRYKNTGSLSEAFVLSAVPVL